MFFKKLFKFLFSRMLIVGILIILQIAAIWLLFEYWSDYNLIVGVCSVIFGVLLMIFVINKDEVPEYKIPWLLVTVLAPVLGVVLYLIFGNNHPGVLIKRRYKKETEKISAFKVQNQDVMQKLQSENAVAASHAKYLYESSRLPLYECEVAQYFCIGEEMLPVLLEELKKAKSFIFMEYFILEEGTFWDSVLDILKQKADEGVEVRVMYDDLGSINTLPLGYAKKLKKCGIRAQAFAPFIPVVSAIHNNRDHRKITVIDNLVAFTGGMNIADEYINQKKRFGVWKDTGVMLKGGCVRSFTRMFLNLWNLYSPDRATEDYERYLSFPSSGKNKLHNTQKQGYVLPFCDGPKPFYEEQVGKNVYLNILNSATDYVYITTPYLVCDNELLSALRMTARRGVDVRLITPYIPDKKIIQLLTRSNYAALMEAGVKIYEYTPGFIHAKTFLSDDKYAVVGTINLDYRSLTHHFECGVWLYDVPVLSDIKTDLKKTIEQSRMVLKEEAKLNLAQTVLKSVVQVFTPLL